MPTYEYECTGCGHQMEAFQGINDKPLKSCPQCHKPKLKRKISGGAGLLFRGTGFYETDYRSASYQKAKENDKPAAAPSAPATPPASEKKSS